MYKLHNTASGIGCVLKEENSNLIAIPFDPANTDYQQYLAWLSEGNTPQPADEVTQ